MTSATLMANGSAFHHAVLCAKENPRLGVGVHLALVGGRALSRPNRALPATLKGLVAALVSGDLDVEKELDAQIRRVLDAGIRPTHFDTHKHTHILPPVLRVVARLAQRHGVGWIRPVLGVPLLNRLGARAIAAHGRRTVDHLAGYRLTGNFGVSELMAAIDRLRPGVTEFFCHPGYCREELRQSRTRLKESRERELAALTAPGVREHLRASGVTLISYADL